jgi:hypothetical protein
LNDAKYDLYKVVNDGRVPSTVLASLRVSVDAEGLESDMRRKKLGRKGECCVYSLVGFSRSAEGLLE